MKTTILTIATVAVVAVSAQAQVIYAPTGKAHVFTGAPSYGSGDITYQWYRNGQPIANATDASYTMPGSMAHGERVEIKRGTMSSTCPDEVSYTNSFIMTFCNVVTGAVPNAVCWADNNVNGNRQFASRPDAYTSFFQWNRLTAWAATGSVSGWNSSIDTSSTWQVNPCPVGWRIPTGTEFQALVNLGSTWADENTKGNAVAGRFLGPSYNSCSLLNSPASMEGCIFFPAVGWRSSIGGLGRQGTHAFCWSSTSSSTNIGCNFEANNSSATTYCANGKQAGFSIRCVR